MRSDHRQRRALVGHVHERGAALARNSSPTRWPFVPGRATRTRMPCGTSISTAPRTARDRSPRRPGATTGDHRRPAEERDMREVSSADRRTPSTSPARWRARRCRKREACSHPAPLGDELRADESAGARPVVDDEVLLRRTVSFSPTMRASVSALPPGANGATIFTGRAGQSWACAVPSTSAKQIEPPIRRTDVRRARTAMSMSIVAAPQPSPGDREPHPSEALDLALDPGPGRERLGRGSRRRPSRSSRAGAARRPARRSAPRRRASAAGCRGSRPSSRQRRHAVEREHDPEVGEIEIGLVPAAGREAPTPTCCRRSRRRART